MGCCVSSFPAVAPDLIPSTLPADITRLNLKNDGYLIVEALENLTNSFAGTVATPGEGALNW